METQQKVYVRGGKKEEEEGGNRNGGYNQRMAQGHAHMVTVASSLMVLKNSAQ